jgi:transcriptional regulator with XRE-family HTH domain
LERLRHTRELAGYSQQELADETGVSQHTISQIELGQRKPQGRTLRKLAKALGVEVADLFGGWQEAFDNSLRVRADAKENLRERLESWEAAREEGAGEEIRRELLDEVGRILDETNEAVGKLLENVSDGLDGMADPSPEGTPNAYWEEVRKIDTLYRELVAMVRDAGLSVRSKTPRDAVRTRHHELEALAG